MVEANAITNLNGVSADFLRPCQQSKLNHEDIREIFVDMGAITEPTVIETPIGGTGEVDTHLDYPGATNEQISALKGLFQYIGEKYRAQPVNKYFTINRKQQAQFLGDTWVLQRTTQKQVKNLRVSIEQYAPVLIQRQVRNVKVVRPIYVFAPY